MRRVDAALLFLALALLVVPPLSRIHLHRSHSCRQMTHLPQRHSSYLRCT